MNFDSLADQAKTLDDLLEELADAAKAYGSMAQRRKMSQERLSDGELETNKSEWEDALKQLNDRIEELKQEIRRIAETMTIGNF